MKKTLLIFIAISQLTSFAAISSSGRKYELWDNYPSDNHGNNPNEVKSGGYPYDKDWEQSSYPIGNGYMGANVFGRTDTERVQITEKTLGNYGLYGIGTLTSFEELFFDFNQPNVQNYKRSLVLNDAMLKVDYDYNNVHYSREYFANYPDKVIVIKLTADKKGELFFTLRPEIPYLRSIEAKNARTGKVVAKRNLITISGTIPYYHCNYESQVKVLNEGGKLQAINVNDKGQIRVEGANSAVIIISAGTNYVLNHKIFLEDEPDKKLNANLFPHRKLTSIMNKAIEKGYSKLKSTHLNDFHSLFSRVQVCLSDSVPQVPTRTLLDNYSKDSTQHFIEELMYHYGRYLLISSSRKGALPAGLQGVWSQYEVTPWTGGYWHNINIQMNYWGAFNSNLAETFIPYFEYFNAYYPKAILAADEYIKSTNPQNLSNQAGENGWTIGTGATPFCIQAPGGHSGPGTGGLTTKLFWDYFAFTQDTSYLRSTIYPALLGMSKFLSKTLVREENGLLLVSPSASPEQRVVRPGQKTKGEYYVTKGTTFDQGFVWENYHDMLTAAQILGVNDEFLNTARAQIGHLDPILIGTSGQVKEFREEDQYGEIGDKNHRHVSHLCPLFPGTLINSTKPEWIKGVEIALDNRGDETTGWAMIHRMNLRARTKEAEKAWLVYSKFIKERTYPNLWATHPPFQIDANLGTVAGVAEMLLQSHENFIELLPALPTEWASGEYSGLKARGNFEVDVKWNNGKANYLHLTSHIGGSCSIKYTDIAHSTVKDKEGKIRSFTVINNDLIAFDTSKDAEFFFQLK